MIYTEHYTPSTGDSNLYSNWSVTINNYGVLDYSAFRMVQPFINYYIIGYELSKDGRTPHLQCFVQFKKPLHFKALKSLFPRAHIEAAKYDPRHNISYCKKDGSFEEYGELLSV